MAFIRYSVKAGGVEYASVVESVRVDGAVKQRTIANLGRVLDKQMGVYKSRERGVYRYTMEDGYGPAPEEYLKQSAAPKEREILDFGNAYVVIQLMRENGLLASIGSLAQDPDTLWGLLLFRILEGLEEPVACASTWLTGSWAREYLGADALDEQRVSSLLEALDEKGARSRFLEERLQTLREKNPKAEVLLVIENVRSHSCSHESGGKSVLAAMASDGDLLYASQIPQDDQALEGLLEAAGIVHQSGIPVRCAVLPASFAHMDTMRTLWDRRLPCLVHLGRDRGLYETLLDEATTDLASPANAVRFEDDLLYVSCRKVQLFEEPIFAYVCLDVDERHRQYKRAMFEAMEDNLSLQETDRRLAALGTFVLLSSHEKSPRDILDLLHRASLPEEIRRGAASLLDLMALIAQSSLERALATRFEPDNCRLALLALRNQKCKVYTDRIEPIGPDSVAREAYAALGMECPTSLLRGRNSAAAQAVEPDLSVAVDDA